LQLIPVAGLQSCDVCTSFTHTPLQQPGVGEQDWLSGAQTAGFTQTQLAPSVHGWVVLEASAQTSSAAQQPAAVVHDRPVFPQAATDSQAPDVVLHDRPVQQSLLVVHAPAFPEQLGGGTAHTPSRHFSLGVLQQSPSAMQVWPVSAHCGPPTAVHWPLVAPGSMWQERPKQQSPSTVQLDVSPWHGARQIP
jgi:hypothetical protein